MSGVRVCVHACEPVYVLRVWGYCGQSSFVHHFVRYSLKGAVWVRDPRRGHRLPPGVMQVHQVRKITTEPPVPFVGLVLQMGPFWGSPQ